jgi:hypothetical protein
MPKITIARYLIAFTVMLIGFLPMGYTALLTPDYLQLTDYLCAIIGFLLAVHITEVKVGANGNDQP